MDWLLGVLFFAVLAFWLFREARWRGAFRDAAAQIEDIPSGHEKAAPAENRAPPEIATGISRAASEMRRLRRQRELAEANLEIILSSMQEGVLVADGRRTVRLLNPSAKRLFSVSADSVGTAVTEALREPAVEEMIAEALRTGTAQECEIEAGPKGALILAVRASPMRDAAGDPGALVMFRDVTRLTQLEKMRREFVANVSHELRTPLAIFQGYVENLQDCPDMPDEDRNEALSVLAKHSKRLNALVEDLLALARIESRMHEMVHEEIEIRPFFDELRRDWAIRMSERGVQFKTSISDDLPPLHADRMRIEQIFTNLLDNALKYTPRDGEITIGAALSGDMIEFWVKDTGQGILSADLPHIFERFYRADKARSRELGGTGLGLSIVKHIAQAHGGSVSAESVYGSGTTIRFKLPVEPKVAAD